MARSPLSPNSSSGFSLVDQEEDGRESASSSSVSLVQKGASNSSSNSSSISGGMELVRNESSEASSSFEVVEMSAQDHQPEALIFVGRQNDAGDNQYAAGNIEVEDAPVMVSSGDVLDEANLFAVRFESTFEGIEDAERGKRRDIGDGIATEEDSSKRTRIEEGKKKQQQLQGENSDSSDESPVMMMMEGLSQVSSEGEEEGGRMLKDSSSSPHFETTFEGVSSPSGSVGGKDVHENLFAVSTITTATAAAIASSFEATFEGLSHDDSDEESRQQQQDHFVFETTFEGVSDLRNNNESPPPPPPPEEEEEDQVEQESSNRGGGGGTFGSFFEGISEASCSPPRILVDVGKHLAAARQDITAAAPPPPPPPPPLQDFLETTNFEGVSQAGSSEKEEEEAVMIPSYFEGLSDTASTTAGGGRESEKSDNLVVTAATGGVPNQDEDEVKDIANSLLKEHEEMWQNMVRKLEGNDNKTTGNATGGDSDSNEKKKKLVWEFESLFDFGDMDPDEEDTEGGEARRQLKKRIMASGEAADADFMSRTRRRLEREKKESSGPDIEEVRPKKKGDDDESHSDSDDDDNQFLLQKKKQMEKKAIISSPTANFPETSETGSDYDELMLLGRDCERKGDFPNAESHYLSAAQLAEERSGNPECIDAGIAFNAASIAMRKRGALSEASSLLSVAKKIYLKEYGENHPEYAAILNNLGGLRRAQGRLVEAVAAYTSAVLIIEKNFGTESEYAATLLNNLAQVYRQGGNLERAASFYHRALNIAEKHTPSSIPLIVTLGHNLSQLHKMTGAFKEAEQILAWVMSILEDTNEEEKIPTRKLRAENEMKPIVKGGSTTSSISASAALGEEAKVFAMVRTLQLMGKVQEMMGTADVAKKTYKRALLLHEGLFGESNLVSATLAVRAQVLYKNKADLDEAALHMQNLLDAIVEKKKKQKDSSEATFDDADDASEEEGDFGRLVSRHRGLGNRNSIKRDAPLFALDDGNGGGGGEKRKSAPSPFTVADEDKSSASRNYEKLEDDHDVAVALHALARIERLRGKSQEALQLFSASAHMYERLYGVTHPTCCVIRSNYASCLLESGDVETAEAFYRSVMVACEETVGSLSPQTAAAHNNLAKCLQVQKKIAQSQKHLEIAIESLTRVLSLGALSIASPSKAVKNHPSLQIYVSNYINLVRGWMIKIEAGGAASPNAGSNSSSISSNSHHGTVEVEVICSRNIPCRVLALQCEVELGGRRVSTGGAIGMQSAVWREKFVLSAGGVKGTKELLSFRVWKEGMLTKRELFGIVEKPLIEWIDGVSHRSCGAWHNLDVEVTKRQIKTWKERIQLFALGPPSRKLPRAKPAHPSVLKKYRREKKRRAMRLKSVREGNEDEEIRVDGEEEEEGGETLLDEGDDDDDDEDGTVVGNKAAAAATAPTTGSLYSPPSLRHRSSTVGSILQKFSKRRKAIGVEANDEDDENDGQEGQEMEDRKRISPSSPRSIASGVSTGSSGTANNSSFVKKRGTSTTAQPTTLWGKMTSRWRKNNRPKIFNHFDAREADKDWGQTNNHLAPRSPIPAFMSSPPAEEILGFAAQPQILIRVRYVLPKLAQ